MTEAYWFTLGQQHAHKINGKLFDRDTVIEIEGDRASTRARMIELCGNQWSMQYKKGKLELGFFPEGVHVLK